MPTTEERINQLFDCIRNAADTGAIVQGLLAFKGNRRKFTKDEEAAIDLANKFFYALHGYMELVEVALSKLTHSERQG